MPVIPTDGGRLIDYPEGTLKTWVPQEVSPPISEDIRGFTAWLERRRYESGQFALSEGRPFGHGRHYTTAEAERTWKRARKMAEQQVELIKDKIDLDDAAQEALTETLTIMRGPISADIKLKAARQVLDFTMAKPVAKSEVTVNTAEDWLKSIAEKND